MVSLFMAGCVGPRSDGNSGTSATHDANNALAQVTGAQGSIENAKAPLAESGTHIDKARDTLVAGADPKPAVKELEAAKSKLEEGKTLVDKAGFAMDNACISVTQAVAAAAGCEKRAKDAEARCNDLQKKLDTQSAWVFKLLLGVAAALIVAGIGLCVASIYIGFSSVRVGLMVSGAGIALLILTLTLQQFKRELVCGCAVLLLLTAAYFLWQLFVSAKANKELVQFGEAVKSKADGNLKTQLFGDNNSPVPHSLAHSIQSDTTQAIVSQVRQHLAVENAKKN
jgi:hypothetical protein